MLVKEEVVVVVGRNEAAAYAREEKNASRQQPEEDEKACFLGLGFPPSSQQRKSVVVLGRNEAGYGREEKNASRQPEEDEKACFLGLGFPPSPPPPPPPQQRKSVVDYRQSHPEVTVLDPPDAIQHLHNRQYMLQEVADMNFSDSHGKVGVPRQLVVKRDASCIPDAVSRAGLRLPIVAKPLVADGSAKSHELSLAYDRYSLQKLEPPLVLQEFVNHGGVMFKVYIVGEAIKVVRRFSLPNVSRKELSKNAGVFPFPRVSCAAASADEADLDPSVAELPPRPLLERFAKELRRRLGLRLFNLDIIREHGTRDHYYVIDINYFPGYGKMPEYEYIFTDFLLSLAQSKYRKRSSS